MNDTPIPHRPGQGATSARLAEILRVDHAGEMAAVQIYRGQRAVLGASKGQERIAASWRRWRAMKPSTWPASTPC